MEAGQIKYDEKQNCYTYCISFTARGGSNKFLLFFNEKGKFSNIKPYVFYRSNELTLEETKTKQMEIALEQKGKIEELITFFILPKNKEEIVITEVEYDPEASYGENDCREFLTINFELNKQEYLYQISINNPRRDGLFFTCLDNDKRWYGVVFTLKNIPSFEGVEGYLENHPKVRVKYVNELARYEQAKKAKKHLPQ